MATIGTELTMHVTESYSYLCRANQSRARDFTASDQVHAYSRTRWLYSPVVNACRFNLLVLRLSSGQKR